MNEIFLWFWLADIMGGIGVIGFICTAAVVLISLVGSVVWESEGKEAGKKIFKLIPWFLVPIAFAVFLPNKDTIKIYAVAKAGQIATTETEIGKKGMQALEAILDDIIEKKGKK